MPRPLRRPRRAVQVGLIGIASWFTVLFAALGVGSAGPATVSVAFAVAAIVGLVSVGLVSAGQVEPGVWSLGTMLMLGQAAAVSLAW